MLHYRYLNGEDDNWFANNGYALNVWGGFESIGYDDGIIDVVPIYWNTTTKVMAMFRRNLLKNPRWMWLTASMRLQRLGRLNGTIRNFLRMNMPWHA